MIFEMCYAIPPSDDPEDMIIVGLPDGSVAVIRPPCTLDPGHAGLHTWQEGWEEDARRRCRVKDVHHEVAEDER
jgi:hypothetical protein